MPVLEYGTRVQYVSKHSVCVPYRYRDLRVNLRFLLTWPHAVPLCSAGTVPQQHLVVCIGWSLGTSIHDIVPAAE